MSVIEELTRAFAKFRSWAETNTIASIIAGRDGLPMFARINGDISTKSVSMLATVAWKTAERIGESLVLGDLTVLVMRHKSGLVIITPLGKDLVLLILTKPNTNLGLLLHELSIFKPTLEKALQSI